MAPQAAPRRRGRILVSVLLLLLVVGPLPLLATAYIVVTRYRETLEFNEKRHQLDASTSLSEHVWSYVHGLDAQLVAIAHGLESDAGPGGLAARIARIRESKSLDPFLSGEPNFYSISVVDRSGSGTRSGQQLPDPAVDEIMQEAFQEVSRGKGWRSRPVASAAVRESVMVIGEPIMLGNEVAGAVLAVVSLSPMSSLAATAALSGGEAYIVDGGGRLIAHSNPKLGSNIHAVKDVPIVREFVQNGGRNSATMPFTLGDVRLIGTYRPVPVLRWGVMVQVEEAKAFAEADRLQQQSYLVGAGVALFAIVLGLLFARQLTQPITELAAGARKLAAGEYGTRVNVKADNEVGVLGDAFNQMGSEIQKAIEQIRKAAAQNKELFMGSIRMLANAIDEKDPYTRGHSERVAYYSMVMAKHMGMTPAEVENVHLSGIIHDVGKIGIEDKILRKPAALTDDEYEIMKQHPTKGAHILEAVPLLKQMAGPGLMHHENWDGSGYPEGLKGEQIPLLGRIVSVADAFDAMTTDRPYSKAMTFEKALERLRFLAGKKFDALCVDGIEKAAAAGDLTAASARKASIQSRKKAPEAAGGDGAAS